MSPGTRPGLTIWIEHVGERCVLRGGDEHGADGATGTHERPDDAGRLGDEEPPFGLDPAPERRIRQRDIVGEPRIVGVGDVNDGHRLDRTGPEKTLENPRWMHASAAATCNDAPRTSPAVDGGHL